MENRQIHTRRIKCNNNVARLEWNYYITNMASSHREIINLLFNTSCLVIKFNQDVNRSKLAKKQMQANCFIDSLFSNINNSISAPALGAGGRGFESRYPD